MTTQSILERDPEQPAGTGTLDDLLAEVAMTYPLAGYGDANEADAESAFDHQILAGLVSP